MANLIIKEVNNGIVFKTKIVPGSSPPTKICGLFDDMLKIKVTAAPEKGKANHCLVEFLAKKLGVKRNAVKIITGHNNPVKKVQVTGISAKVLLQKLNLNKPRS